MRAEAGTATLSTIAFGAGIVSAGLQMILQCFQAALAVAAPGTLERGTVALFVSLLWALSVIAYVPMVSCLVLWPRCPSCTEHSHDGLRGSRVSHLVTHFVMTLGLVVERG